MTDAPLLVTAAEVGYELGLDRLLGPQVLIVERAIRRVQAQVEAFLGQPIIPREQVETGRFPFLDGWDLTYDPIVEIVSTVAEEYPDHSLTGLFTVTYTWGLDARTDPDLALIREFVIAHAAEQPSVTAMWRLTRSDGGRRTTSASTEGQSASFEFYGPNGASIPSSSARSLASQSGQRSEIPVMDDLIRWKRRSVFVRKGLTPGPFDRYPEIRSVW